MKNTKNTKNTTTVKEIPQYVCVLRGTDDRYPVDVTVLATVNEMVGYTMNGRMIRAYALGNEVDTKGIKFVVNE